MNISELKADFVIKYNGLFTEVAIYYGIENNIFFWNNVLATIDITKIGYIHNRLTRIHKSSVFRFLEEKYPKMVPFYNFFYDIREMQADKETLDCRHDLVEINKVVKEIRNMKSFNITTFQENSRFITFFS